LADTLALLGRKRDAFQLFQRLLDIRNDVGLLSEEYDPHYKRLLGNSPQAFSHISLVNTAFNLSHDRTAPATDRGRGQSPKIDSGRFCRLFANAVTMICPQFSTHR
jgi:hypothetical protein